MHYTGLTYRPPYEAGSLLLQVTAGCSHNACRFCVMYKGVPFAVSPLEEVFADIDETAASGISFRRAFLLNGDAFVLPAERLLTIARRVRERVPSVETVTCYASVNNIIEKTDDELRALADAGFSEINVGLESGLDDVLAWMNKGYDLETARTQLKRLRECGVTFSVNIINAAAGPDRLHESAQANARIINEVGPSLVFVSPLHADPGSPVEHDVETGAFVESTLGQYVEEEIELLWGIEEPNCYFYGEHVSNPVPVAGWALEDKDMLVGQLEYGLSRIPLNVRNSHPSKGSEGRLH